MPIRFTVSKESLDRAGLIRWLKIQIRGAVVLKQEETFDTGIVTHTKSLFKF
jgi:hypothetical protein